MKKVIRLTESDLKRIVRRVLNEDVGDTVSYDSLETEKFYKNENENYLTKILYVQNYKCYLYSLKEKKYLGGGDNQVTIKLTYFKNYGETFTEITEAEYKNLILTPENTSVTYAKGKTVKYNELEDDKYYKNENYVINMLQNAFYECYMFSIKDKKYLGDETDNKMDKNIGEFNMYGETFTEITEDEYKKTISTLLPSDKPTPNNNTNPKPTLNDNNTIPTGVVSSDGVYIILDKNRSLGILDGEYSLSNDRLDNFYKNYETTKNIPDSTEYFLELKKKIDGINVLIDHNSYLTIKDGKLIDNIWKDLFYKFNKASFNTRNDLSSDANKIIKLLLKNKIPCFEIDKEDCKIEFDTKTGNVFRVTFILKSKCDEKIPYVYLELDSSDGITAAINQEEVTVIWDGKDLKFGQSDTPNDEVTPTPNNNVTPKPTLNNNNTTPTGVVDSYSNFVLDENVSLGVLGDSEYVFYGEPLENDGKTKKIPDGSGYYLKLIKILNGYKVSIGSGEALTINGGILNGTTWGNFFNKINNVSMTKPNDLLSNEDDIFQSLLDNTVPCFEIDKEKEHKIKYDVKTGVANTFILYLKSKCNKKITSVRLTLDKFDKVNALVNGKMANTIWDGNDLKFKRSKNEKLIIKVNENVRKALKTYF